MYRWLSILCVVAGTVGISACGGDGNPFGTGGVDGTPRSCDAFDPPLPGCDDPCPGGDLDCQSGTFCFDGVCSAQCSEEQGCGEGFVCNSSGRCLLILGGTGGTGGTGTCNPPPVTTSRIIPNVMFLVDQSGSMNMNDFGPMSLNRWTAAHSAITSIVSDPLDDIVRFGLTTYTSRDGDVTPPCPRLPVAGDPFAASARVDFGLNNESAIGNNSVYPSSYPSDAGEDTPTGDSIDTLVGLIQASPPPNDGPTIIVVATDGEPDSCEFPDPSNNMERDSARQEVVDAAAAAHAADIDVFVLWVGELSSTSTRNHLQDVANAGVEGTGMVWVGDDPTSLSNAFQSIVGASVSCEVKFDKAIANRQRACDEGTITLGGTVLDCPTEWNLQDGSNDTIVLLDDACDTWKAGGVTLTAEFPCGVVVE